MRRLGWASALRQREHRSFAPLLLRGGVRRPLVRACGSRWLSNAAESGGQRVRLTAVPRPTSKQLVTLALASGVPFVGFGFADNAIMILVGDRIDASLGVRFGLSTLAAAGLGNLISDVVGISLGEMIEAFVARFITAPPLAPEQLNLRATRLVKGTANAFGISIGCLLGMAPLLFIQDRKTVFFDDDEMALFHRQFAPYGVSPQQFFALLHHGKWRVAEAGTTIVERGQPLNQVYFLQSGRAQGTSVDVHGHSRVVAVYAARDEEGEIDPPLADMTRGCIIGGSALIETKVAGAPYPNTVTLTRRTKLLEWNLDELKAAMREDKSIEAAVLSTLYLDLVRGIREQRQGQRKRQQREISDDGSMRREYELVLRAVLADGIVHPLEKAMLRDYATKHQVSSADHEQLLGRLGWTHDEFERGRKDGLTDHSRSQ